jgi:hypothetical protein
VEFPVIQFIGYGGELVLENASFDGWIQAWLREPALHLEPPETSEDELKRLVRDGKIISATIKYQDKTGRTLQAARRHVESLK